MANSHLVRHSIDRLLSPNRRLQHNAEHREVLQQVGQLRYQFPNYACHPCTGATLIVSVSFLCGLLNTWLQQVAEHREVLQQGAEHLAAASC